MSIPVETIIDQLSVVTGPSSGSEKQILTDTGFIWRERDGVRVLVCQSLEHAGFLNGFSTRLGGVSPFPAGDLNLAGFNEDTAENIGENRRRFLNVFGNNLNLATVWQIHGDVVKTVESDVDIASSEDHADALVSKQSGLLVGVKTADCVPVLIGDPTTGAYAAIHAGWRGTAQSIVSRSVGKLIENYGADPKNFIAAIGPAASGRNYEIGEDVIDAFAEKSKRSEKYFSPTRPGHALVDLHLANRDQLLDAGVAHKNIFTAPFCTMERSDLFFSYRIEKKKNGKTGRHLSVIGRR